MGLRQWVRANRETIDAAVRRVVPGIVLNDEDRMEWVRNDEGLYNWAPSERVRV